MKKFIFVFSLFLFSNSFLFAAAGKPIHQKFLDANKYYEQDNYDDALKRYLELVSQGYEGPSLFYNIGNVYYRQGERGHAILWYKRALQLSPRDADIQFNLSLARSHLKESRDNWLHKLIMFFTGRELGLIFTVIWWSFFILLGFHVLGRLTGDIWPALALWFLGISGVLFGVWMGANIVISEAPVGIVTKLPGEVRNGPGKEMSVGFTVPEGTEVVILNQRPDWVEIGLPQEGLKGWMPRNEIENVNLNSPSSN